MSLASKLLARSFSASSIHALNHVTVIGGGLMGSGITQVIAQSGINVTMVDLNETFLKVSQKRLDSSLSRIASKKYPDPSESKKFLEETYSRISTSTNPIRSVSKTDLVIEAIVEDIEIKKKLFKSLDESAPESAIFTSNTSSLPISDIASSCSSDRLKKFGGLHFFNPVPVMKLVEIIKISETSQNTIDALTNFCAKLGKVSVEAKDTPGFIVNRLLVPYMMNAVRMSERGEATAKDIDIAMKLGAGYPMGPFALLDYVGLDTSKFIIDGWHSRFPDVEEFKPSPLLNKLVQEGKLGVKSGEGFFKYK